MKRNILGLFLLLLALGVNSYGQGQKKAIAKFDNITHDFGTITDQSPIVSYAFKFTNTGNLPLVINQAIGSCGCTIPTYSKKPIAPGERGEILVKYNGKGTNAGKFHKKVYVISNAGKTDLSIEGTMVYTNENKQTK